VAAFRCERLVDGEVDRAIALIGSATLARCPEGAFLEVSDDLADRALQLLAYAGVRATFALTALVPREGLRAAVGRDLTPLPLGAIALDLVHVRTLPLGAETTRLLRAGRWRRSAARVTAVRELLRGEDAAMSWRRRAWLTRDVLRSRQARRVLRPVVFDAAAIGAPPEHRVLARQGALGHWMFS
jgi:hypothetical protein